jgi:predicted metal-binding membrane protein
MAAFVGVSALLFAASAVVAIVWGASMSAMGEMPMPGGWTMSMAWMRIPGQTWPGAAASFLGMWVVMMVAMMLPSLVPMLWRYREAVGGRGEPRLGRLTALVGMGYFFVWTVFGMAAFPLGVALAAVAMQQPALARAVPMAVGAVVLIAGFVQLSAWKARHLACCREVSGRAPALTADAGTAWRHGLRLGLHCSYCCAPLTVILLVIGVMDLRAMAVVGAAITVERLAPAGERVARAIGAVVVGAGLILIARAVAALLLTALQTVPDHDHARGEVLRHALVVLALPLPGGVAVVGVLEKGHVSLEGSLAVTLRRVAIDGARVGGERLHPEEEAAHHQARVIVQRGGGPEHPGKHEHVSKTPHSLLLHPTVAGTAHDTRSVEARPQIIDASARRRIPSVPPR